MARQEWGMEGLMNPLKNIRKPSGSKAREQRLQSGEYEALRAHLIGSGNPYAAAAFDLAIETSLRQGKLFALRWGKPMTRRAIAPYTAANAAVQLR